MGGIHPDEAWAAYAIEREQILEKGWWKYLAGPDTRQSGVFRWQSLNYRYEPREALASLRCPLLAIYGELDDNIADSENVPASERQPAANELPQSQSPFSRVPITACGCSANRSAPIRNQIHRSTAGSEFAVTVRTWLTEHGFVRPTPSTPDE